MSCFTDILSSQSNLSITHLTLSKIKWVLTVQLYASGTVEIQKRQLCVYGQVSLQHGHHVNAILAITKHDTTNQANVYVALVWCLQPQSLFIVNLSIYKYTFGTKYCFPGGYDATVKQVDSARYKIHDIKGKEINWTICALHKDTRDENCSAKTV